MAVYFYQSPSGDGWRNLAVDRYFLEHLGAGDIMLYFYINENGVGSFADPFTFFADASSKTVNDCWSYMQRQFKELMSTCK